MSSLYDKLEKIIDRIENEIVLPRVKEIRFSFIVQVVYHIILILLGVLSSLEPSTTSAISAFGFGSLSFGVNFGKATEDFEKFRKDRVDLIIHISVLKIELGRCDKDDEVCLKRVDSLIKVYLSNLLQ